MQIKINYKDLLDILDCLWLKECNEALQEKLNNLYFEMKKEKSNSLIIIENTKKII